MKATMPDFQPLGTEQDLAEFVQEANRPMGYAVLGERLALMMVSKTAAELTDSMTRMLNEAEDKTLREFIDLITIARDALQMRYHFAQTAIDRMLETISAESFKLDRDRPPPQI